MRSHSPLQRLLKGDRPAQALLVCSIAAGFLATAMLAGLALLLSAAVAWVFLHKQGLQAVVPYLVAMLGLALGRGALIGFSEVLAQRSACRVKGRLRADLTRRFLQPGSTYTRLKSSGKRSGELVNAAVEGVEALDEYISLYLPLRALAIATPFFIAVLVLWLDPPTTIILLVTMPVLVLFLALIGGRSKELTERRFFELSWMSAFYLDILQGLATLKMFGRSREQAENIRRISQQYANTTLEVLRTAFQSALVLEWGSTIATALVAVEISLRLMNGRLPFERALAVLIITPEFFLPLRQYAMRYHVGTAGKAAAGRIYSILDRPVLAVARPAASAGRPAPERLDIYFEDVSYYYEDGERPALQGASLRLPHGKATALVGVSGSGKTTVARLLLRFIEPEQGAITVDGTPLAEIERLSWAATVAWVPQHPYLFAGTVAENLRLARPGASEEELIAAARAAHAHPFIEQLPLGYDTPLGEKGARLSGGQAQRLAIGRAFLKDASLLILDEATSQLDQRSEALIRQALARLVQGRTTLIISHRMQWAVFADQVVVLEAGRAIQAGAHAALIEQDGAYRRLAAAFEKGEA